MINLANIQYHVVAVDEEGKRYKIRDYIENLGWEENEKELSARLSFTVRNDKTSKGYLSGILKPGCLILVSSTDGGSLNQEVIRGYVNTWNPSLQNSGRELKCVCYDELYSLQKSQENLYFPSGTGTKSAVTGILNAWKLPLRKYEGPDVAHGKLKFNNRYLSDILLELLDDAVKKGGEKCILRAAEGKVEIVLRGSNKNVYIFRADNIKAVSESQNIDNLVTRVTVTGQADDEGKSSVEATLDGFTKYGIRQRIYVRSSDETPEAAKSAAQEILNEEGTIKKEISLQGPDVPVIRKGDRIELEAGLTKGSFYVKSVRHDADACSMSVNLEKTEREKVKQETSETNKDHNVGDIVNFHGGTHYISSYPGGRGYSAGAGPAKITKKNGSGQAHPWHLIHADSTSNVYGWVDDGTFD